MQVSISASRNDCSRSIHWETQDSRGYLHVDVQELPKNSSHIQRRNGEGFVPVLSTHATNMHDIELEKIAIQEFQKILLSLDQNDPQV